ncbi:MAG: dCTP deaminase [Fimbriimonadaceae bacterium]
MAIVPEPNLDTLLSEGQAAVDLHLGRWFLVLKQTHKSHFDFKNADDRSGGKDYFVPYDKPFTLHPGRFVLAVTVEWIRMPFDKCGLVLGRSTVGRRGLVIETAPGIQPGFNGCLALEMANVGEIPVTCFPGMRICQLFIDDVKEPGEPRESAHSCQIKPSLGGSV